MNTEIKNLKSVLILLVCAACSSQSGKMEMAAATKPLDIPALEEALGMKGTELDGEYKVTVPQNDLHVVVDSFKIIPPMGLGSWAAFSPAGDGAMVMGDIILTETDLKPVEQEVINQGLTITAIHNHFLRDKPHVMYMHIGGMGDQATLAAAVKAVFASVAAVRGGNPAQAEAGSVQSDLNMAMLDSVIGVSGKLSAGVYKQTIGRPDVTLKDHGATVSTFMGFNTWAAWQGTMQHAAVAGDFVMLENEVAPVVEALIRNNIEVVAVHNHMVHEQPRVFFLHYWGVGPAEELARGLKEALSRTGK